MINIGNKVMVATQGVLEGADVSQPPLPGFRVRPGGPIAATFMKRAACEHAFQPTGDPMRFVDAVFPCTNCNGESKGLLGMHHSWLRVKDVEQLVIMQFHSRNHVYEWHVSRQAMKMTAKQVAKLTCNVYKN